MTATEREEVFRSEIIKVFDNLCPHIANNPFIPHWPTPRQQLFLGSHMKSGSDAKVFECLYGGAAGGGKSDAILMSAAQWAWKFPEFKCLILRRTFAELAKPGAIMDRAISWWGTNPDIHWDGTGKTFTFPSGAKVAFGYLQSENDHLQYQGAEFHQTCWDELTQFPRESQYRYIGISRVRRSADCKIPLRTLSSSNPGGPGHEWVRMRFVGDPENGIRPSKLYIPATIADNPHIDQKAYVDGLMGLHPTVREQLLNGDWSARDPGDYFRREWFGPLLNPDTDKQPQRECIRIRWWDLAASENIDAARTAGVLMSRNRMGMRAIEHAVAFRATPGRRDDLIVQQAQLDGTSVVVGIEIEPGSGGQAQFETLGKRLRKVGVRVVGARPRVRGPELTDIERALVPSHHQGMSGKAGRADPVASCLERGYRMRSENPELPLSQETDGIRLFSGNWTQMYLDEVEGFPNSATCDLVDATSGAWAWLEANSFPSALPPQKKVTDSEHNHNLHPQDRDDVAKAKNRGKLSLYSDIARI